MNVKRNPTKMRIPHEFRTYLYEEKARNPDRTFQDILKQIAKERRRKPTNKQHGFWGKI